MIRKFYVCGNKRCRSYLIEFSCKLSPAEARFATGRPIPCVMCGSVAHFRRVETTIEGSKSLGAC